MPGRDEWSKMPEWKINTRFAAKGPDSLAVSDVTIIFERGDGPRPGFLTIDIYPECNPKYPARHFGTWQYKFEDIEKANSLSLKISTDGVGLFNDGAEISSSTLINGPLKEDGLYKAYVVLAAADTYDKIAETVIYRHLSFSGKELAPAEFWPEENRRHLKTIQAEYWMMTVLCEKVKKFAAEIPEGADVLDFGGGSVPYYPFFAAKNAHYVNVDVLDGQFVNIVCKPGDTLDAEDKTFDAVICTHVLEHTRKPRRTLAELYRVLKPGGKILVGIPFAWENHNHPLDYWRFGRDGVFYLFEKFSDVKIETDSNSAQALLILKNCLKYRTVGSRFLRNLLIRWGNFRYRLASRRPDDSLTCNFIITATRQARI